MTHTAAQPFRWHIFARHAATIGAVFLLLGLAALIYLGMRPLRERATRTLTESAATIEFRWPQIVSRDPSRPAMTWIPREWQEKLLTDARATVGARPDPLDPSVLSSLRDSLDASGWFEKTPMVRRDRATGIVIEGEWRTPAAVVRYTATPGAAPELLWLSTNAFPMPKVAEPGRARPKVLENPASGPPTNANGGVNFNAPWTGDDINAGLDLLALVAAQPWAGQIAGVDLSEFTTKESLTLTTTFGTRVVWGGPPSKPRFGDTPTKDKLRHIATLFGDTRRVDGGHPTVYVDSAYLMFDRSATAELRRQQAESQGTPTPPPSPTVTPSGRSNSRPSNRGTVPSRPR